MQYRGIIFDKDGTLFDYYAVWAPIITAHTDTIVESIHLRNKQVVRDRFLRMLGIGDGNMHPKGLVFKTNKPLMLLRILVFCIRYRLPFKSVVREMKAGFRESHRYIREALNCLSSKGTVAELFRKLKSNGYSIGVVTSDTRSSTDICLRELEIETYVDFISTFDDTYPLKPKSGAFTAFCRRFGLDAAEVVVVGDALVDMKFAIKSEAGYRIAVMTGANDRKRLQKKADVIYEDLEALLHDTKLFP